MVIKLCYKYLIQKMVNGIKNKQFKEIVMLLSLLIIMYLFMEDLIRITIGQIL